MFNTVHLRHDRVLVHVLLVYAFRKIGRQTSAQMKRLTGKAYHIAHPYPGPQNQS